MNGRTKLEDRKIQDKEGKLTKLLEGSKKVKFDSRKQE